MKSVLTLVAGLLAVIQFSHAQAQAQCTSPSYTEQLTPNCATDSMGLKYPNYQNTQQYWICSNGSPLLQTCPSNTPYFTYAMQTCTSCGGYIPAMPCSQLPAPSKQCSAAGSGSGNPTGAPGLTYPTPIYTNTSTTQTTTTKTTTTKAPVTATTKTTTTKGTTVAGPPVETGGPGGTTAYIPGPPSPQTNNPNLAMPPTPLPTPPVIVDAPPQVSDPPVQPKLN